MAVVFEEGVPLQHPARTNAIVRDDEDEIELEQDAAGVVGPVPQRASVQQLLDLAGLLLRAAKAKLPPEA